MIRFIKETVFKKEDGTILLKKGTEVKVMGFWPSEEYDSGVCAWISRPTNSTVTDTEICASYLTKIKPV
jgi:hypothetical protein